MTWDGHAAANAEAAIRVATTIDFEDGDEVVTDTTQPAIIGWRSSTQDDLDGVSFLLFVKRGVVYVVPPVLSFVTPPISFDIPIESLAHHVSYHPVDHTSGVVVLARQIENVPCPHGHLAGKWIFDANDRTKGEFHGEWLSADHNVEGLLSGTFWTEADGRRLMHGQVSGVLTDQVILELDGVWCLTPHLGNVACVACADVGYFVGRWKYTNGSGGGKWAGTFGEPDLTNASPELPFRGVWIQHCDRVTGDADWVSGGK
jgi:hypothetical protein